MEISQREVDFGSYCRRCKYDKLPEDADPCYECLENPVNTYSAKPIFFEVRKDEHKA